MTLAVVVPLWFDRPPLEALEVARHADRLGYEELWIGEMVTFDAFALAGAIARDTTKIPLVVGPMAVGVRSPVTLAMALASVTALGARPAHLALGASNPKIISLWHDRPWPRVVRRMRETVAVLRQLLSGERTTFAGETVSVADYRLRLPAKDCSLSIAAFGPQMLRAATEVADRVVVNLVTPQQIQRTRAQMENIANELQCPCPPLVAWVPAALDPGPETYRQLAQQVAAYLGAPGYGDMFSEAGFGDVVERARAGESARALAGDVPSGLLDAVGMLGDVSAVQRRVAEFREAGADVIALVPATAEDPGGERLLTALASA